MKNGDIPHFVVTIGGPFGSGRPAFDCYNEMRDVPKKSGATGAPLN
jgi:hypothetical protein